MRALLYILFGVVVLFLAAGAALTFDSSQISEHEMKWQSTVANEVKIGSSRDAVNDWINKHELARDIEAPQIFFDRTGDFHRPSSYEVVLEHVPQILPFALCSSPVIALAVAFDGDDRVSKVAVHVDHGECP